MNSLALSSATTTTTTALGTPCQAPISFEPFWDPNEASLDSLVDESDEAAATRIALEFEMIFGNGQTEQKEQNEPDIAPAAFEPQAAAKAPTKTQRKARPYNSMVCATCFDASSESRGQTWNCANQNVK